MNSGFNLEEIARLTKEELQKALSRALEELGFGKQPARRGRFGRQPDREAVQPQERKLANQENGTGKEQHGKGR